MKSGRVRYDFAERLEKSKEEFKFEMFQKTESTVEGIEAAIQKGMNQRSRGKIAVERSGQELIRIIRNLDEIREKLINIKECADGVDSVNLNFIS